MTILNLIDYTGRTRKIALHAEFDKEQLRYCGPTPDSEGIVKNRAPEVRVVICAKIRAKIPPHTVVFLVRWHLFASSSTACDTSRERQARALGHALQLTQCVAIGPPSQLLGPTERQACRVWPGRPRATSLCDTTHSLTTAAPAGLASDASRARRRPPARACGAGGGAGFARVSGQRGNRRSYRLSRAIRRTNFGLRLSSLANYIQTMVTFFLNYD
jgi:hypothetical protein